MIRSAMPHLLSRSRALRRSRAAATWAVGATSLLLSACGALAALVPPLSVGDPLGVDGQIVSATLQDGAIGTQSTTHLDVTRTFDVPDLEANLFGFSLASFHTNAGTSDALTLTAPAGVADATYPERVTVTRALIEARLWDDANGDVSFAQDLALELPFERTACTLDGCSYTYVGTLPLADVLDLEVTHRGTLEQVVSILVLGATETPNQGTFRLAIEVEASTSLSGFVAVVQLTSRGSTIRLGG